MLVTMLAAKIHRATVTDANLNYAGSITIDEKLLEAAGIREFQQVEVVNINNGARFATYTMKGSDGVVCLNGAAARLAQPGDLLIIMCYAQMTEEEADAHSPKIIHVNEYNHLVQV